MKRYPSIETSTRDDILQLSCRLRLSDIDELKAFDNETPFEALNGSFENSKLCFSYRNPNDQVEAMFGVGWTHNPRVGRVWFLSTENVYETKIRFLRVSNEITETLLERHDAIFNYVHSSNIKSIRWLEWLGFKPEKVRGFEEYNVGFVPYFKFTCDEVRDIYVNRNWPSKISQGGTHGEKNN